MQGKIIMIGLHGRQKLWRIDMAFLNSGMVIYLKLIFISFGSLFHSLVERYKNVPLPCMLFQAGLIKVCLNNKKINENKAKKKMFMLGPLPIQNLRNLRSAFYFIFFTYFYIKIFFLLLCGLL